MRARQERLWKTFVVSWGYGKCVTVFFIVSGMFSWLVGSLQLVHPCNVEYWWESSGGWPLPPTWEVWKKLLVWWNPAVAFEGVWWMNPKWKMTVSVSLSLSYCTSWTNKVNLEKESLQLGECQVRFCSTSNLYFKDHGYITWVFFDSLPPRGLYLKMVFELI